MRLIKFSCVIGGVVLLLILSLSSVSTSPANITLIGADESLITAVGLDANVSAMMNGVRTRFLIWYAEQVAYIPLRIPSTSSERIPDRIYLESAEQNIPITLNYPRTLVYDEISAHVSAVQVRMVSADTVSVMWTTDKFTKGSVGYGLEQSGYTWHVHESRYAKVHTLVLTDLVWGEHYVYLISGRDLNGNLYQSDELRFWMSLGLYLPLVMNMP